MNAMRYRYRHTNVVLIMQAQRSKPRHGLVAPFFEGIILLIKTYWSRAEIDHTVYWGRGLCALLMNQASIEKNLIVKNLYITEWRVN